MVIAEVRIVNDVTAGSSVKVFSAFTLLICYKNVTYYSLLRSKTFSLKIWLCKILDKYHVWVIVGTWWYWASRVYSTSTSWYMANIMQSAFSKVRKLKAKICNLGTVRLVSEEKT